MFKINNWRNNFLLNHKYLWCFFFLFLMAANTAIYAQEEEEEPAKKEKSRMGLSTTQMPGDSIELSALLRAKIDDVYQKIGDAEIEFFAVGAEDEISLGKSTTNALGTAKIKIGSNTVEKNEEGYMTFSARFDGNDELKGSDDEVSILKANMTLTPVKEDSSFTIKINVSAPTTDSVTALAEADVSLYVKRMIGRLKVGEGTTDENGDAEINFPKDLSGDDHGNLYITAYIEDFGEYGNLAATSVQAWGKPVSYAIEELPRALWSPNPPIWMVLTFFILMGAVWGHYVVIISRLLKMRKMGG